MFETDRESGAERKDRKLGDEWSDWKGEGGPGEYEIDERMATFLLLAACVALFFIALLPGVWYLIKPRIDLLAPSVSSVLEWLAGIAVVLFLVLMVLEGAVLIGLGESLFSYRWIEKVLLSLLPGTVWLGSKFGISRDRVGNSFIKVHNFMTKSQGDRLDLERLLVLLPRCLKREARSQIMERTNGNGYKVLTAGGGEEARAAIKQYRPTCILAIACERDLMSGIKDVAERIPVLAIPNRRPEGPCKNTEFSLSELEETLRFITEKKNKKLS